jgi:hypothetical protein
MAKERTRNDMRSRIAHIAARLMAEDGIEDHALAKRKAARQIPANCRPMRKLTRRCVRISNSSVPMNTSYV